jgi:3-methyladenine DNA glycosylase AlkD
MMAPSRGRVVRGGVPKAEISVEEALAGLRRHATPAGRDGLHRYGIPSDRALGVPMRDIQALAKRLGRHHGLALALWDAGWYEARVLAAYVDEPEAVTRAQMDRWCRDFDNWAICDAVCFALFDRTAHAWPMVRRWANRRAEFEKRAAFALLWGLTVHDKQADDGPFLEGLALIERAASDERHYVKKALSMALRAIGKRNSSLKTAAIAAARRLAASDTPSARWLGADALRELARAPGSRRAGTRK